LKKKGITDEEVKLSDKIFLFNQLPDKCSACESPFDKEDRQMVFAWKVVVRDDTVRLFCPVCVKKAQDYMEDTLNED
jgi:hypothetical protein